MADHTVPYCLAIGGPPRGRSGVAIEPRGRRHGATVRAHEIEGGIVGVVPLRGAFARGVAHDLRHVQEAGSLALCPRGALMLTDEEKTLIQDSWRLVVPIAETAADLFYRRLFELAPQYRALFPADLALQKQKLTAMLGFIVRSLSWPASAWEEEVDEESDLFLVMLALGRRHSELYRVPDAGYDAVGAALLWTLDYGLGKKFDERCRAAWTRLYGAVALAMRMGKLSVQDRELGDGSVQQIVAPVLAQRVRP